MLADQGERARHCGGGLEVPLGRYSVFGEVRGHFLSTELRDRLTPLVLGVRF